MPAAFLLTPGRVWPSGRSTGGTHEYRQAQSPSEAGDAASAGAASITGVVRASDRDLAHRTAEVGAELLVDKRRRSLRTAQVIKERARLDRALLESHVSPSSLQRLAAKGLEVAADGHEDFALADVHLVGLPGLRVLEPAVDHHVAAVADAILPDVVAKRFAIVFRVRRDRPFGLAAGIADNRRRAPAGGILGAQPI